VIVEPRNGSSTTQQLMSIAVTICKLDRCSKMFTRSHATHWVRSTHSVKRFTTHRVRLEDASGERLAGSDSFFGFRDGDAIQRAYGYPAMSGKEPATQSFIEVKEGRLVLSSIKPSKQGGGRVIRLWNPTGQRQADTIRLWRKVKAAMYTDLSEKPVKGRVPRVAGKEISIMADPNQIWLIQIKS
jgi:hypothetical protein